MEKNKTGKYLKYAIGEILLVAIGILIAVQINTWNQNRIRLKLEKVLLEQLKGELSYIYDDLHFDHGILKFGDECHFRIIDYIENDVPYADSMCFDFYIIKRDEYIYPKDAVYGRIKEEGLDIIRNDTIRYITQLLYESTFPRISRNNSFTPDISEFFNDYYLENFKPNNDYSLQFNHIRVSNNWVLLREIDSILSRQDAFVLVMAASFFGEFSSRIFFSSSINSSKLAAKFFSWVRICDSFCVSSFIN